MNESFDGICCPATSKPTISLTSAYLSGTTSVISVPGGTGGGGGTVGAAMGAAKAFSAPAARGDRRDERLTGTGTNGNVRRAGFVKRDVEAVAEVLDGDRFERVATDHRRRRR